MKHLLAVLLILGVSEATSDAQSVSLEIVTIEEETNSLDWVTLKGSVRNVGSTSIEYPKVIFTFKKAGRVIGIETAYIDGPSGDVLMSGEVGFFEESTVYEKSEYDEYTVRFDGRNDAVDPQLIIGDIHLVEESTNVEEFLGDAAIYGEFVNRTNAVLSDVELRFTLYDSNDDVIGFAEASSYSFPDEVYPGDIISFMASSDVSVEDVSRWECVWTFVGVRLKEDVPTAVSDVSWGAVKALASW